MVGGKILPGTGRGTSFAGGGARAVYKRPRGRAGPMRRSDHSVVFGRSLNRLYPSTILRMVPLPVPGRIA